MKRTASSVVVGLLLGASLLAAQNTTRDEPLPPAAIAGPAVQNTDADQRLQALASLPRANAEYRLGPGDLIEVGVFGVDEFRHTLRIAASGLVKLPLIEPVMATGLTAAELEQRLTSLLGSDVIKNPQVSVFVKEYRSQPVYVLGAVRSPGQYQITLQLRIVDALSLAGGLLPTAGDEAVIQRPTPAGGEQIIRVDLANLLERGDLSLNVLVQGGDVIHVRERPIETIYVVGEVNRAGAFTKPPKQDLRVSQVIAWAGGPMKTAKLNKGMLVRYSEDGKRQELPVNFKDILNGKVEDFLVQANDIIFLPGSTIKNLGYGVLNGLPGTVATLPYRIP
jgi:polysaccharide export outer membrane protein